jgi:hypothetical protein
LVDMPLNVAQLFVMPLNDGLIGGEGLGVRGSRGC